MARPAPFLAAALAAWLMAAGVSQAQPLVLRVVTGGDAWLCVTNAGVLGNNFITRSPSFEYPTGSGFEHLVHAGLWVGARAADGDGPFIGVVTGGLDQVQGTALGTLTEWTPVSGGFAVASSLPNSLLYDPAALSHDQSVTLYDDRSPRSSANNPEPHRPIGLRVRQITHAWSAAGYTDFVVTRFVVTSQTVLPVADVWVGVYAELASGPRDLYATWPPSASWFRHKRLEWDPAWRMLREHYCREQPEPDSCHFEYAPPWAGLQLLTPPGPGQQVTLAAWDYQPLNTSRDSDAERYGLMSAGTVTDLSAPALRPEFGDPVELLAIGPFQLPGPDDSLEVAFAFVGGADVPALQQHARSAQALYDAGYRLSLVDAGPPARPPARLSLAPLVNPSVGGELAFTLELPSPGSARLELFDLAGRCVARRDVGPLAAGRHAVSLAGAAQLAPGIYQARVTADPGQASTRAAWLR